MNQRKKIPCRVCGNLFEPCAYCKTHADTFRWRNFACSIECAKEYMNKAINYRASVKNQDVKEISIEGSKEVAKETETFVKKKKNKVDSERTDSFENIDFDIKNEEDTDVIEIKEETSEDYVTE